jgi:hypothetical protein
MSGVIRIVANFCDCRFSRFYVDQVGFASPLVSFGLWSYEYLIRSKCDRILRREPHHERFYLFPTPGSAARRSRMSHGGCWRTMAGFGACFAWMRLRCLGGPPSEVTA